MLVLGWRGRSERAPAAEARDVRPSHQAQPRPRTDVKPTSHIHRKGQEALDAFLALPWKGAVVVAGPRAGRGSKAIPDLAITYPDGLAVAVELKRSSTSVAQLRALDYRTLVVSVAAPKVWWILPPHDVMRLAARYAGQHTMNSFECCNPDRPTRDRM